MKLQVRGKNVLVTGSSMGIGKGLAELFAREGANLFLADHPREEENLVKFAEELSRTYGVKTRNFCADLTDPDGPEKLHAMVAGEGADIHVLVNNAGICWFGNYRDMPLDRLQSMLLLNCVAYAKMSRLFLPPMMERNEGGILNISSVSAFQPVPTLALYAATKAFTQSLTEALREELPMGSRVVISTLNPAFTKTHLIEDASIPSDYIPLKISFMSIEEVTRQGIEAFMKGKELYVPGLVNKVFYLVFARHLPRKALSMITQLMTRRLSDLIPRQILALLRGGT